MCILLFFLLQNRTYAILACIASTLTKLGMGASFRFGSRLKY